MTVRDPYALLGVGRDADDDEIRRAYRRLARELHPDAKPDDPEAEERFKEVSRAYELLRDPERRRRYDLFGDDGTGGADLGGDAFGVFGDVFDAFFSGFGGGTRASRGPTRAPDVQVTVEVDLAEAAFGAPRSVTVRMPVACTRCEASGCEPGTRPARCATCDGRGEIREVRRSILGQLVTAAGCPACGGEGVVIPDPCRDCGGEGRRPVETAIEVEVPAGIEDGQRLRYAGRGPAGRRGGPSGDLYVAVRVRPHATLHRDGPDLHVRVPVAVTQAILGAEVTVDTLEGPEVVRIPAGTQPGARLRLPGRGVPLLRGRGRGDLYVEVEVQVPTQVSEEEAELVARLAELRGEPVRPTDRSLRGRIRSAFR